MVDHKLSQDSLGYLGTTSTENKTWASRKTATRLTSWIAAALISFGLIYTVHNPRTGIASKPLKGGVSALDALDFSRYPLPPNENSTTCPQPLSLSSTSHAELEKSLFDLYEEEDYRLKAFEALGGAIRVPTESYDDLLPVGQDSRWDIFAELHTYLETSFPLVFDTLEVTKVNTHNIVLHWQGSDATLKPVLLTAHQDVVPVEPVTVDAWIHPPYSGYYDGTWIWGRGSSDDKSDLVSQIVTIDTLLKHGFKPRRTIVIAWGIDEEASGLQGAGNLGPYLEKTYGKDGFAMLVDEGGSMIIDPVDSTILAVPDVSEKGYLDVRVEVNVLGGHSSVPPEHTGIGILSALLTEVEANPHTPQLGRTSTPLRSTLCLATYSNIFPPAIRRLALDAGSALDDEEEDDAKLENLMHELIKLDKVYGATLRTSQAIDLVWGGVKVNALPERATGIVDHRIAEFSSVKELQDHITSVLAPVVASFNLSLTAFNDSVGIPKSESAGEVILSDAWGNQLEPSPITPTGESGPWKLLAGTIKATVEATGGGDGEKGGKAVVIPGLTIGNTDTRFYWPLTKHIFRYSHKGDADSFNGGHTINEAVRAEAIMNEIKFFTKLIFNMDETTLFD